MVATGQRSSDAAPVQGDDIRHWHALHADETLIAVASDRHLGLSDREARRRLAVMGPNALPEARRRSAWAVVFSQFKSPLIYLLLLAAAIALALGHVSDAVAIFTVVVLNAVIGAVQEGRAERSLAALRKLGVHKTRVLRGGVERIIATHDVVPGDIVVLEAGDAVPADARLLDGAALQIAEAALTGESVPIAKSLQPLDPDTPLADRRNMIYAGTHVTAGRARAVVVATGQHAEIGHIAMLAESAERLNTPLERRLAQFSRYIVIAAAVMFVVVIVVGLYHGLPFGQTFMIGISQLVGMIPEGLPVAMTIALAVGVQRMARRRAIVRQLSAVETLGSTTVICSDKTGTLTRNEMTVTAIALPGGREITVTGSGYAPEGTLLEGGATLDALDADVRALIEAAVLCNDARLQGPDQASPGWRPIGDPTEVALVTLAIKAGLIPDDLRRRMPRAAEIPFDPAAQMMATQHGSTVFIKGAPEVVLELCRAVREHGCDRELDDASRRAIAATAAQLGDRALRVLAVGVVPDAEIHGAAGFAAFNGRVILLGLLGQIDPPRAEVRDAVQQCRDAGIRPVMVTGDHKMTGLALARALGISRDGDAAVDGRELEQMSDVELAARIDAISVFARVHPAQKLRIVHAYQQRHEVVAMTGDGVNDAPALVKADVGIAMGITGTEAAKEAAKIVITDDNFASIVAAVEEGRVVYRNIKKVLLLLFSTSAAEVIVLLAAMLIGYPPPFAAVQILWNNLVSEGLITVNLIMEPPEGDEMRQRPVPHDEPLLTRILLTRMAFMVPAIVVSTLGWFIVRTAAGVPEAQVRTETFTLLVLCEWFNVLNCRSATKSALDLGIVRNPWLIGGLVLGNVLQVAVVFWEPLGRVFHTVPFSLDIVIELGVVASLVLWVEELRKLWVRRSPRR
ncbi:MAG: HAD-IC family P-type ATPase [Deltaproteobacteria bacterium]|nr:HAD-IC family P-type ATPase [Deltaproteobacteria bacterium]